ncbi:MAG: murein biosynthesis integral membrane protein MurJ [Acidobacteria bacterium]|nr:murein biosynthesis integral membrane protein MurJ [Acidobacteriota bacterium]
MRPVPPPTCGGLCRLKPAFQPLRYSVPVPPDGNPSPSGSGDERYLARRAGSVSLGVVFSRLTGLVREQTLAFLFPTRLLDAFYAAYTFPNTLREMLAEGALSKAFVATFASVDQGDGREAAHRLLGRVLRVLLPVSLLVTVAGVVFAPQLVDLVFSRGAFDTPLPEPLRFGVETPRELAVWLTRIMFPFIACASLASLFMGGLQARNSFFLPAVASSFFNVTTIVFAALGFVAAPRLGLHPMAGLALGVPLGGLVQLLVQWRWFRRDGYRPVPTGGMRETVSDPAFRRVCRLFAPAAAAAGTLQINVIISRHFASAGTSWLAWFAMAYRLVQLPSGLIGVALSSATLPALTRAAGRGDREGFGRVLGQSGRLMLMLTLAAAAGLIGIAAPFVALIYQRGAFSPEDARQVSLVLSIFALGLPAFGATKLLTDAFFALGSTRPPLLVAAIGTVVTWLATRSFVVVAGFGHLGLPLATVCVAWFSTGLLAALLAGRLGSDASGRPYARALFGEVAGAGLRAFPVAAATGGAAWLLVQFAGDRLGPGAWAGAATTLLATAAGTLVFVFTVRLLAPREWDPIRDALVALGERFGFGRGRRGGPDR